MERLGLIAMDMRWFRFPRSELKKLAKRWSGAIGMMALSGLLYVGLGLLIVFAYSSSYQWWNDKEWMKERDNGQ